MSSFNDCRCQKCNTKIDWLGELTDPPPCKKCGHTSDYGETERKLEEVHKKLLRKIEEREPETCVVNFRLERCDVKITRRQDNTIPDPPKFGCFGNPFPVGVHGRDKCIELFEEYFLDRLERDSDFAEAVLSLKGKRLGCFCKPKRCHGDVIKAWLDEQN